MAQSTTNLGKIHVFPSEALYNQFKDIIADNDLALLKDDGAYIVAALLEQNGYVKFSNGLILQWGVVTDDRSTLTFLLPFSNSDYFYAAFPTNKVNVGGINIHGVRNPTYLELYSSISNNSNTANNWQFSGRNINPCWLAVGI